MRSPQLGQTTVGRLARTTSVMTSPVVSMASNWRTRGSGSKAGVGRGCKPKPRCSDLNFGYEVAANVQLRVYRLLPAAGCLEATVDGTKHQPEDRVPPDGLEQSARRRSCAGSSGAYRRVVVIDERC